MNAFVLKIIACITMFIDHIGYAIFNDTSYFNYIGRIAFPIFSFQISEGYTHTKSLKKYLYRLLIFALVSQIPFMLFSSIITDNWGLNVIFTLSFGLISIAAYDKCNKLFGIIVCIALGIISEFLHCDYGFYGVAITFLFYVFNNSKILMALSFTIATIIKYGYNIFSYYSYGTAIFKSAFEYYFPFALCTLIPLIFICLYNKKKGPNSRYILYLFYPLHMLFVYAISFVI